MTLLKRATIKSYDAASHRAAVGISGSLSVWLDSIAISDSIPAATVVPGRECAVLFHTEDNPDDAVVISIHGGGPPASGGGDSIEDADGDTKVQTEESADEDKLRFDTAGTERLVIDDSGNFLLKKSSGHTLGGSSPFSQYGLYMSGSISPVSPSAGQDAAVLVQVPTFFPTADGQKFYGLFGQATVVGSTYNVAAMSGLQFSAVAAGGGAPGKTITDQLGVQVLLGKFGSGFLTINDMTGFKDGVGFMTPTNTTIDRWNTFWSSYAGTSAVATHTGLRVTDITAGTNKYLIWAGPNTPSATGLTNLRLDAGNPPNAASATEGDSQLNLTFNENGTLVMRRLRWRQQNQLGATDRVVIC